MREMSIEDKERVKHFKPGRLTGMFCVSYGVPKTVFYCSTKEKRERLINNLNREDIKIYET